MPPPGACLYVKQSRYKQDGFGRFAKPQKFLAQDYEQLKQYCLKRRISFTDETFRPDRTSIGQGLLSPSDLALVQWLRPAEIAPLPAFILDGVSRFDFGQGILGNCWFLASIGALTFQKQIFAEVVPLEQTFDENYCGLFHFRFWRFGHWMDVVIDDKLPTINGRLIFVHSKDQNEFWPALLEKAYAKVCGSYTDMNAGTPSEAMMDFTGGVHISVQLSDPSPLLWRLMCRAGKSSTLMGCGTPPGETSANTELPNGLVQGHTYAVTGVKEMKTRGKIVHLVRLWNPWGKGEWKGDWSDQSPLWQTVSSEDRERCLLVADDGEFWMTFEDFCKFYTDLDICGLSPDFVDGNASCHWKSSMYEGQWVTGTTAGGCMNNRDSFWTNPQYRVKISGGYSEKEGDKNIQVSLMQMPDKRNRRLVQNLHIGFAIFELTEKYKAHSGKLTASFFNTQAPVAQTKTYLNAREVMEFFMLKPGEYLIVPSTFNPNETAHFLLTIHSKAETNCYDNSGDHKHELDEKVKIRNAHEDENKRDFFHQYSDKYAEVDAEQLQRLLNENILKGDLKSGGFSIDACRSMVALMDESNKPCHTAKIVVQECFEGHFEECKLLPNTLDLNGHDNIVIILLADKETSITGKLNREEFVYLWNKVVTFKEIFFRTDVSRTGTLSLRELRNAFSVSGMRVTDKMLNLMALRYGASSGHMTLESFISLILRLDCMNKIFRELSDGKAMTLGEFEWMCISMYT